MPISEKFQISEPILARLIRISYVLLYSTVYDILTALVNEYWTKDTI